MSMEHSIGGAIAGSVLEQRLARTGRTVGGLRVAAGSVPGLSDKWLLGTVRVTPGLVEVRSRLRRTGWIAVPVALNGDDEFREKGLVESLRLGVGSVVVPLRSGEARVELMVKEQTLDAVLFTIAGPDGGDASLAG